MVLLCFFSVAGLQPLPAPRTVFAKALCKAAFGKGPHFNTKGFSKLQIPPCYQPYLWRNPKQRPFSNHSLKMGDRWNKKLQSSLRKYTKWLGWWSNKQTNFMANRLMNHRISVPKHHGSSWDLRHRPDHWWHAHRCTSVQIRALETTIHVWNMPKRTFVEIAYVSRSGKHQKVQHLIYLYSETHSFWIVPTKKGQLADFRFSYDLKQHFAPDHSWRGSPTKSSCNRLKACDFGSGQTSKSSELGFFYPLKRVINCCSIFFGGCCTLKSFGGNPHRWRLISSFCWSDTEVQCEVINWQQCDDRMHICGES